MGPTRFERAFLGPKPRVLPNYHYGPAKDGPARTRTRILCLQSRNVPITPQALVASSVGSIGFGASHNVVAFGSGVHQQVSNAALVHSAGANALSPNAEVVPTHYDISS